MIDRLTYFFYKKYCMMRYIIYAFFFYVFIKFIFAKLNNPLRPSGYASDYLKKLSLNTPDLNV